jgi:hypothetical protein
MKSSSRQVLDTQLLTQAGPNGRGELCTPVRGQLRRHSISGDPTGDEGVCAGGDGDVSHGQCLQPARGSIHNCEQIPAAPGGRRQGPFDVHLDVREMSGWDGDGLRRRCVLPGSLGSLTLLLAVLDPCGHIVPRRCCRVPLMCSAEASTIRLSW